MTKNIHNSVLKGVDIKGSNISIDSYPNNGYDMSIFRFTKITNITISIVNIAIVIINIYILCHFYPRTNLSFDYLGLIIGILSIIVTFSIGIQIFQTVNITEKQNKIKYHLAEFEHHITTEIKNLKEENNKRYKDMDDKIINLSELLHLQHGAFNRMVYDQYVESFLLLLDCLLRADKLHKDNMKEGFVKDMLDVLELDTHKDIKQSEKSDEQKINSITAELTDNIGKYKDSLELACKILIDMKSEKAITLYNYMNDILNKKQL